MSRRWLGGLVIGVWAVALGGRASMAAEAIALQPPLQQWIKVAQEGEARFFDRAVGGTLVYTVRLDARQELMFTREAGALRVRIRWTSGGQAKGEDAGDTFSRAGADHPFMMELDDRGQAQRVVDVASQVEPIRQSLAQTSGVTGPIDPVFIETAFLKSWNSLLGVPWAVLAGRPLEWGTAAQFKGKLQLGLPQYGRGIRAIEETPVVGSVTVTEDGASGSRTFHVRYTYRSEATLDEEARTQFARALGDAATHLPDGRWLSASITGTTEGVMERATLMFHELTAEQELRVEGDAGISFREERTVKVRRAE